MAERIIDFYLQNMSGMSPYVAEDAQLPEHRDGGRGVVVVWFSCVRADRFLGFVVVLMSLWNELNAGGRCFCYLAFPICLDLENKTFQGPFWAPQLIPQPSSKGEERANVRESWGEQ